ncbi:MAG: hypothetical protein N0C84_05835 [Candidatus Thiodiazotropha taylori]|uniref:Sulfotransferase family protein n=1 Tax=Candidatus Thiodiazotropha taylori TaxID=2792791 RepID=A0A9E4KBK7_9GAMM|nr:hypothetical protein [Candidatus Thiodiazotropha taylori]MCW4255974.1 hypothetical protein [Candidatus Thiodiazotropha taylori]
MIYVVSGIHRSGTSMMMKVLMEGGIKPYWSKLREKQMMRGRDEYEINPDGFWEVGQQQYMQMGFTSTVPDESCIKIQAIGLPILSAAKGYKIVLMRREPEAIKQSYQKAFPKDNFEAMYPSWPSHYWQLLDGVKGIMEARRDVDLIELWYDDALADPHGAVDKLISHGFPLRSPKSAALVINPEYRRFVVNG